PTRRSSDLAGPRQTVRLLLHVLAACNLTLVWFRSARRAPPWTRFCCPCGHGERGILPEPGGFAKRPAGPDIGPETGPWRGRRLSSAPLTEALMRVLGIETSWY